MRKLLWVGLFIVVLVASGMATKTIEVWTLSLSPWFDDYLNEVVSSFERENPGIKVEWVDVPYNAAMQMLQASIAAGNPPDAVNLNTVWVLDLVVQEALAPLDPYFNEVEKYRFFEGLWNSTVVDGASYAAPWYATPQVLIYNTAIFEEAGLDPTKPPKTFDEMTEMARIIRERTGKYGIEPNILGHEDLMLEGVQLVSEDGMTATFNTPVAIEKLKWYQMLYNEDLMPRSLGGYASARETFSGGRLAMYPVGLSMLKHIEDNSPSVYAVTEVAPLPLGKGEVIKVPLMNFAIPYNAKHPAEAAEFMKWILSAYHQNEFCKHATILPSTKISLGTDPHFKEQAHTLAVRAAIIASESLVYGVDMGVIPNMPLDKSAEFRRILNEYWMDAIKGEFTAEEALRLAEEECNDVLRY